MLTVGTYKTRDGDDVKIVAVEDGIAIGYIVKRGANRGLSTWRADNGRFYFDLDDDHSNDIIDTKPRIKFEKWVTLYREAGGGFYIDVHNLLSDAKLVESTDKVAITKIVIDCVEGENLD